jgi:hypothetical protein
LGTTAGTSDQIERLRAEGLAALAAAKNESALLDAKGRFSARRARSLRY